MKESTYENRKKYIKFLELLNKKHPSLIKFDLPEELCPNSICTIHDNGILNYVDEGHLSPYGWNKYGKYISDKVDKLEHFR